MSSEKTKIQIIIGSTRQGRYSDKAAQWLLEELKKETQVEAELVDLRDYTLPFFDEPISPMRGNGTYTKPEVQKWADKIKSADAYIMITPEYNHGYSAVLKNAIDHLYPEWNYKPVGFLSYGAAGGARAVEQMRQVVVELKMLPVKDALHIQLDTFIATMQADAATCSELFTKALRGGFRDHFASVIKDLCDLAEKTRNLRSN